MKSESRGEWNRHGRKADKFANDVFVVRGPRGETLIPVIEDVIVDIDIEAGQLTIRVLPGLLDPG